MTALALLSRNTTRDSNLYTWSNLRLWTCKLSIWGTIMRISIEECFSRFLTSDLWRPQCTVRHIIITWVHRSLEGIGGMTLPSKNSSVNWKSQNTVPGIPAVILPWETSSYSLVIKLKEEETYKYMTSKYQTWHSKQLVEIFSLWPKMLQSVPKWKDFVSNRVKVEGLSGTILLLLSPPLPTATWATL